jgi:hypothetical protein
MPKPRTLLLFLAAISSVGAIFAPAAGATVVGNGCTADNSPGAFTVTQIAQTSSSLPVTTPAGVITSWGVSVIKYGGTDTEKLKVLRPSGAANTFATVAETAEVKIPDGSSSFDARIPVQAGDHVGVASTSLALVCSSGSGPGDVMAKVAGDPPLNSPTLFETEAGKYRAAVTATVEPDVDGDGFGDETQDKCPQSALTQLPCPALVFDAVAQSATKTFVNILVATSTESAITLSASAQLPAKAKKAKTSSVATLAPINQLVTPGKIATYTLNFTKALKDSLAVLPRSKSISLTVTGSGKSLAGLTSTNSLTVKLKGQAKPKPKAH